MKDQNPGPDPSPRENDPDDLFKFLSEGGKIRAFVPGVLDVFREIKWKYHIKTLKEYETDRESMYLYDGDHFSVANPDGTTSRGDPVNPKTVGTYRRGEPELKRIADATMIGLIEENIKRALESGDPEDEEILKKLNRKRKHDGIRTSEVNEVLNMLRRYTFVDRSEMNPESHIPLINGILNLKTWQLEDFNPRYFYTWKVNGRYDPSVRSLNDVPQFKKFLLSAYRPESIPTILDYLGYCFYPGFPRQKILVIVGTPGMGKGTLARIMEFAMPEGYGRISLMKLLDPSNKFALQSIEGKNLPVDMEIKRQIKKSADFDVINSLFGGDVLPLEKKFKAEINYIAKSKGILIGNLPLFYVNNMAFMRRLFIVSTQDERKGPEIPDLAEKIWKAEGDKIVSLLLNRLRSLIARNYIFSNERTTDETADLWETLADTVRAFVEERTEPVDNELPVLTSEAYEKYREYCSEKGIPPQKEHEFVRIFSKHYEKTRIRRRGENPEYHFAGVRFLTELSVRMEKERDEQFKRERDEETDRAYHEIFDGYFDG